MRAADCASSILVVEDDEAIRLSLKELLEDEGFHVTLASNGAQALEILGASETRIPNLILLDLMMPIKDGFQFRKEQLLDPRISSIPVVVMSADNSKRAQVKSTQCKSYLTKPINIDDVIATVRLYSSNNVVGA